MTPFSSKISMRIVDGVVVMPAVVMVVKARSAMVRMFFIVDDVHWLVW